MEYVYMTVYIYDDMLAVSADAPVEGTGGVFEKMEVFATAVIRNALNCEEAVAAIEEAAELPISLLSATDEAHLGFVGATCDRAIERGTLIDIGGGSTELTRIENGNPDQDPRRHLHRSGQ